MKNIKFTEVSNQLIEQFDKGGAFLTVKDNDGNLNTMTIGWASMGRLWRKSVFVALVRYSRHTYKLMENADDYTVSFPLRGQLKKELGLCGTKSARDIDKFKEYNLKTVQIDDLKSPGIEECDIILGCKIMYKQALEPQGMNDYLLDLYGEENDLHVLYYGEIVSCYKNT